MIFATAALMLTGCAAGRGPRIAPEAAPTAVETNRGAASLAAAQPLVIDVRSQREYDTGHIQGAVLIPHTQIGDRIAETAPDKSQPIYVYCRSGRRSGIAKRTLEQMGYTNVENLGGIKDARERLEQD
jgi:phage shock protein E